jgi:glycosyltransferase involved in cell wall biosynthesis
MRFQACTIITRNYLPQARVLYRSFRQFHPDIRFSVLVFDAARGALDEPFDLFVLEDIGLPPGEETRMPMLYDVTELATALKPWFFRHLLTREQNELLYFDPDIEIFSPLGRLAQLAGEHCLVMTPHTTRPMSRGDVRPNETDILSAGAYNLGFLGLNSDCASFLAWWSERLLREAMIDVANMRFTDQRWMDFAPGYFDTCILKDETCNVAYWNADSRPLTWTGTHYEVNGQSLCFFHFSGFKPENPHLLSSHQSTNPRTRLSEHPALARLCREYAEKLAMADYARLQRLPYGLEKAPGGLKVTAPMRLAYRAALRKHEETGTLPPPSAFSDPVAFIAWLNEPLHPRRCPEITRYFWAIHAARPDVRAAFPSLLGMDHGAYYEWLRHHGRYEIPIPDELIPRAPANPPIVTERDRTAAPVRGVTLTGYLRAEVGTGEAGRLMAAALEASGEKHSTHVFSEAGSRQNHPWNDESGLFAPRYDTNLICINADQLPAFAQEVGPEFFRDRYNIGLWFWEAEVFPPAMHGGFNFLHEVWVTSHFVREAIAKISPIPVFTLPLPLNVGTPLPPATSRAALKLPEGFLFLFSFDFFSVVERKNPVGVIKAFRRAFAPGEGPTLVIKSINGDRNLAEIERLHYARGDRSDIIIRDGYLTAAEKDVLAAACDCYVSLHRAEGFGLTIAEAMLLEKPTIATRYSGNLEFMTDSNSFLCGYNLRRVGHGSDPYPSDARWAEPKIAEAAELMRFVYENPEEAQRRGKRGRLDLCAGHDPRIVAGFIKSRLSQLRRKPPTSIPFTARHPERPLVTKVRTAIEQGVNVRRTVPSLLTWILQGPRRAMKQFLRAYDQHHRTVGLSALDAFKEIDAEWLRERASLSKRIDAQEDEVRVLKAELKQARQRLLAMEKKLHGGQPPLRSERTSAEERRGDTSGPDVIGDSKIVNRADRPQQKKGAP